MKCQRCGRRDGYVYVYCQFCNAPKAAFLIPRSVQVLVGGLAAVWLFMVAPSSWVAAGVGQTADLLSRFRATTPGALAHCQREIRRSSALESIAFSDPAPRISLDQVSGTWQVRQAADVMDLAGKLQRRSIACDLLHRPGRGWVPVRVSFQ